MTNTIIKLMLSYDEALQTLADCEAKRETAERELKIVCLHVICADLCITTRKCLQLHLFVHNVCLSIIPFIHPLILSSIYSFINLSINKSIYPSIHSFTIHPSIHSSIYPFIHLSTH